MSFGDWVRNTRAYVAREGVVHGGQIAASEFYQGAALRLFNQLPLSGTPVYERDWDALIVLDACRVDALRAVADEYDWLPEADDIGTARSCGSMSEEWMEHNFVDAYADEMAETAHVTWNAFSSHQLAAEDWRCLDEVWRDTWDDHLGCVPPEAVTDRAIAAGREHDSERLLVHYMQPHAPFRSLAEAGEIEPLAHEQVGDRDSLRLTVWTCLRNGTLSRERAWEAMLDNLRWGLDEVDRLRRNLDADRVILTADHGDCFGEWGLYGHPRGVPVPELVRVPWVPIDARDEQTSVPDVALGKESEADQGDVDERLAALGYL